MAFKIIRGGLSEETDPAAKQAGYYKPDPELARAQRRAELWESIVRKQNAWVLRQRAAGKIP